MKRPLDQLVEIAQQAVQIGSTTIKGTRPQTVTEKSKRDTFTDVDIQIERKVRSFLIATTPDIGFIGEEEGELNGGSSNNYYWALDPIDGTSNYVHGIPLCATQIALIHGSRAVVSAISLPYLEVDYWAAEGLGAYANDKRISASSTKDLAEAVVSIGDYATGDDADRKNIYRISVTAALAKQVERIRMFGSAAHDLAWVAEGRIDAAVIVSNNLLDIAAGALIAAEAGTIVRNLDGSNYSTMGNGIVAAAPGIHARMLEVVRTVEQS